MKTYLITLAFCAFAMPAFADCGQIEEEIGILVFPETMILSREFGIEPMQAAEVIGAAALDDEVLEALPDGIALRVLTKRVAIQDLMIEYVEAGCY